jgi:WD40 repeat protein
MSEVVRILRVLAGLPLLVLAIAVRSLAASPDDFLPPRLKPLAERTVTIAAWEEVSTAPWGDSRSGGSDERRFAFSPDGKWLATEDAGGWQIELWDVDTGKSLGRFGRLDDPVALAFSPDGRSLLTAGGRAFSGCPVDLWDVVGRTRVRQLDEDVNATPFTAVAFAPDGKTVALGTGWDKRAPGHANIHRWEVASGDEIGWFTGPALSPESVRTRWSRPQIDCLEYAPDGRSLALLLEDKLLLWEATTGKERCRLGVLPLQPGRKRRSAPPCLAFAPDGRTLAVGCVDGAVRLWDTVGGKELLPLTEHQGPVRAVRFAPDGRTLWSFGTDGKVLTWPVNGARDRRLRLEAVSEQMLSKLWANLLGEDALAHYAAVRALAAVPEQSLPFLRERLQPVPLVDSQRITNLVAALDKEEYNERKRAATELHQLGELALPALREAERNSRGEISRRILDKMERQFPTPEQIQAVRALEVLELAGTREAGKLLGELAKGAPAALLTRQAAAALERTAEAAPPAKAANHERLWADLESDDARRAYRALRALTAAPSEAVPFLHQRLGRMAALEDDDDDARRITRLIADLDSDEFQVREKASKELAKLGKRAEPAVRKALAGTLSAEATRRLEGVMRELGKPSVPSDRLQAERALEVLELIRTPEAGQALEDLAKGSKNRWFKEAVADSLRRVVR